MDIDKENAEFEAYWGSDPADYDKEHENRKECARMAWHARASQDTAPPAAVPAPIPDYGCERPEILHALYTAFNRGDSVERVYAAICALLAAAPAQAVDALTMADESGLLPRPICGGKAHKMQEDHPDVWWVGCEPNGCVATDTHPDVSDAISIWNKRAALAARPAAPAGEPVAWLESEESARRTPIKEIMRGMFHTAVWHFSERPQTSNPVWTLHAPLPQQVAQEGVSNG